MSEHGCCENCSGGVGRQPSARSLASVESASQVQTARARTPDPEYTPSKLGRVDYKYITGTAWTAPMGLTPGRYWVTCPQQAIYIRQGGENVASLAERERPQATLPADAPDLPAGGVVSFTVEAPGDGSITFAKSGAAAPTIPIIVRKWDTVDP